MYIPIPLESVMLIFVFVWLQFNIQRLVFEEWQGIKTVVEAKAALWKLIKRGGVYTVHK